MAKNLSLNVPFPVGKIGENPFEIALPPEVDEPVNPDFAALSESVDSLDDTEANTAEQPEEEIDIEELVLQKAQELVAREMEMPMQAAHNVLEALQEKFDKELQDLQVSALKLACAIAGKIIHLQIDQTPEIILEQIRAALKQCSDKLVQTLLLHPEDYQFLQDKLEMLTWIKTNFPQLNIEMDESISRGGCKLEQENSEIDATIESQLAEIEKELL